MASTYSASKYSATEPVKSDMGLNSISSYYTVVSPVTGDVINVCTLPVGAQVHDVQLHSDKALASGTPVATLGYYTSASDYDADAYIVSTAIDGAVNLVTNATAGLTKTFTDNTRIYCTLGLASGAGSSVKFTFVITYTMNP